MIFYHAIKAHCKNRAILARNKMPKKRIDADDAVSRQMSRRHDDADDDISRHGQYGGPATGEDLSNVDYDAGEEGEDLGLVGGGSGATDGGEGQQHGVDIFGTASLEEFDEEFEAQERAKGVSEECIEAGRSFCFLCVYGEQGQAGETQSARENIKVAKKFLNEVRMHLSAFTLPVACRRIKETYELEVRPLIRGQLRPTYTLSNIVTHIRHHDKSKETIHIMDVQTHGEILGGLQREMRTPGGFIDRGVLAMYLKASESLRKLTNEKAKK